MRCVSKRLNDIRYIYSLVQHIMSEIGVCTSDAQYQRSKLLAYKHTVCCCLWFEEKKNIAIIKWKKIPTQWGCWAKRCVKHAAFENCHVKKSGRQRMPHYMRSPHWITGLTAFRHSNCAIAMFEMSLDTRQRLNKIQTPSKMHQTHTLFRQKTSSPICSP